MGFLGRILRNIWYAISGKGNRAADRMATNPDVISGTFDNIVATKRSRINTFREAISKMVAQQETKKEKLKDVSEQVVKYEKLKAGALASGQRVAQKHGGDAEKAKADPEFIKHQAAFRDFASTLEEKKKLVAELEGDIQNQEKDISSYKTQIQSLMRDLEKVAQEKNETIADVISAKERQQVADIMSNLTEDSTSQELQKMREMRTQAKASAQVSQTLSGLDTKTAESEYESMAATAVADDEFSKLMNFKSEEAPAPAPTPVPES
jgi:phage shock protein A